MEENYLTGLAQPTDIDFADDGRIFITEKGGNIRLVENGTLLEQPIYTVQTQTSNERGLQGLELDPNFDANGFIYIYYTLPFENKNVAVRLTMAGNGIVPGSELELMRFSWMWGAWHNGGGMAFDASGKLIIGTGDGTGFTSSQDLQSSLGKILRINTDGSIPTDNPWYNTFSGELRAIAAIGIRNPYTMAVSPSTGRIFFNDVGNDAFEEVNEYLPGKNYGWHHVEGYLNGNPAPDTNYMEPIHVYDHQYGCAVVGATFYEPPINQFPTSYFGRYFFMEYCEGKVLSMDPNDFSVAEFATGLDAGYNNLTTGLDGALYLLNFGKGIVSRISFQGQNSPPVISIPPQDQVIALGESPVFSVDANGTDLSYEWYVNGNLAQSSMLNQFVPASAGLANSGDEITVRVLNSFGAVLSNIATLTVIDGTRPGIQFHGMPQTYAGGDSIPFEASAFDAEQSAFLPADFSWKIDFYHDDHSHPIMGSTSGFTSGKYYVETFGEVDTNVFLRFEVTVMDSSGLSSTDYYDVQPELVKILVQSEPQGVDISVDGYIGETNYE